MSSQSSTSTTGTDRTAIARDAAAGLRAFAESLSQTPVLVGFDGFVDSIIDVVDQRQDTEHYAAIETIEAFGDKIGASAGQSANFELVTRLQKLGGNGPIMANALASFGLPVDYIGALGHPSLHPVFEEFTQLATVHSISDPGYTDALEFADGKLMLGKHGNLRNVNYEQLCAIVGEDNFIEMVGRSQLLGMVNWTMLTQMDSIFRALIERVLPHKPRRGANDRSLLFVDLADPAKRTKADIEQALDQLGAMNEHAELVLGLNLKESTQIAQVLGLPAPANPEAAIEETALAIRERLGAFGVVVHPRHGAAAAVDAGDGKIASGRFEGPFTQHPALSTGAGDNFNAGFCLGLLAELPVEQALCAGTATSGFYVRKAKSPTLHEVASFCDDLPPAEA